jgi:hypothetical protein
MGSGLNKTFMIEGGFDTMPDISLEFLAGFIGLAVLSLVPILLRRRKNKDCQ